MSTDLMQYKKEGAVTKYLISIDDYYRMGEAGIFDDKPRVELINGTIIARSPMTPLHNSHVNKGNSFFTRKLEEEVQVRAHGPVRLDDYSELEPDIVLLKPKENFYSDAHPGPADVYLLIEVAVETLAKDRTLKLEKYAQANIPEYWIVIPKEKKIEVYRKPENGAYMQMEIYGKEDEWEFELFNLTVNGADLLI